MRTVIANALVEITLPDVLEAYDLETELALTLNRASVKIGLFLDLEDVVVRVPAIFPAGVTGELGYMGNTVGDRVITIKKLRVRQINGDMLPLYDAEGKNVTFFTVDKSDTPIVVDDTKGELNESV